MTIDPKDVRDKSITFRPDSPDQKTRIGEAAMDAGMAASAWMRDLLLDEAGYQDMARRRATRRPNLQPRDEETGTAPLVARVSGPEMMAVEAEAARLGISVSDLARIVIEAELDHKKAARRRAGRRVGQRQDSSG